MTICTPSPFAVVVDIKSFLPKKIICNHQKQKHKNLHGFSNLIPWSFYGDDERFTSSPTLTSLFHLLSLCTILYGTVILILLGSRQHKNCPHFTLKTLSKSWLLHRPVEKGFWRGRSSRYRNKLMWRKRIQYQAESNGDTTVMLRNIPNKYTREMLIEFLDEHCEVENNKEEGEEIAYDFLYLPIDFKRELNKGYAFVNFTKAEAVLKFKAACNNKPWYRFGSRKILEISHARIQGKDALVKHFEQMSYPVEAYRAVCFIPARRGTKSTSLTIMVGKCSEAMI
ncbi:hypothetical protein Bca52824_094474 [Brassica carinata]|uniref:Mei2-like C-terminal RNA recognition motif domain-containing protein n=1 Tax=Brassica carinata TaxID=52824 RepID=A0A8X7TIX7_BRACI|nr:hypothetical protein Bca52824_094474 [Brassica carinata]